jgi:hypothetical protein
MTRKGVNAINFELIPKTQKGSWSALSPGEKTLGITLVVWPQVRPQEGGEFFCEEKSTEISGKLANI